ncbi:MAG: membrane protein insertion efficiency factor YidD [Gorillibacterium sp.]|nr:membrane protein insertion efficiency factor YidD [Gorillibacterium sp.]
MGGAVRHFHSDEEPCFTLNEGAGYCIVRLKRIILCIVHLYQHFAPDYIRNSCRFKPSCSEYLILAVSQCGAFKGIYKGVQRIKRYSHHGGDYDWP